MSVQKKKKLETAINNLFATPRAKPAPAEVEESIQESIRETAVEEKMIIGQTVVQPDPNLAEKAAEQAEQPGQQNIEQVIPTAANLPDMSLSQPDFSLPVDSGSQPAKPKVEPDVSTQTPTVAAELQLLGGQESVQMVIFTLDSQYYGIDITAVQSIIKLQAITRLPHVPHYTIGLTNLRGKVVPVFSLRRRFGLPDCPEEKANRIIIIRREQEEVGLIVDGVSEVETVLRKNIEPAPAMTLTISTQFITGIAKLDERLVIFLNVEKVIADS